jgi:hypothetical protein
LLLDQVHDWGHVLLFFILHLINLFTLGRIFRRSEGVKHSAVIIIFASTILFGLGGAIEIIQPFLGREASWGDMGRNGLGIMIANGIVMARLAKIHGAFLRAVGVATSTAALAISMAPTLPWAYAALERHRAFPVLIDFDHAYINKYLVAAFDAKITIISAPTDWKNNVSAVAQVESPPHPFYPGMQLRNTEVMWQDYSTLRFDVYSPNAVDEILAVNIYSAESERRPLQHTQVVIQPGARTYQVALPARDILSAHHITDIIWHRLNPENTITLYFDNISLE